MVRPVVSAHCDGWGTTNPSIVTMRSVVCSISVFTSHPRQEKTTCEILWRTAAGEWWRTPRWRIACKPAQSTFLADPCRGSKGTAGEWDCYYSSVSDVLYQQEVISCGPLGHYPRLESRTGRFHDEEFADQLRTNGHYRIYMWHCLAAWGQTGTSTLPLQSNSQLHVSTCNAVIMWPLPN